MTLFRRLFLSLLLVAAIMAASPATFAASNNASPVSAPAAAASNDFKAMRPWLEKYKASLDRIETNLNNDSLNDEQMRAAREEIAPITEHIQKFLQDTTPKLAATKARLDQLGPKPKEGTPEESPEVTNERAEKEAAFADLDETQRLGKVTLVQAEQLVAQIGDKRRVLFQRQIFERSSGILSPELWFQVVESLPRELASTRVLVTDWVTRIQRNATSGSLLLFALAAALSIGLFAGKPFLATKFVRRDPSVENPSRQKRVLAAMAVVVLRSAPAAIGAGVIFSALDATSLIPERVMPIIAALLKSAAFFVFVNALADAILSPFNRTWRLVFISDAATLRLRRYMLTIVGIALTGKILEVFYQAIAVGLPISVASRGLFALAAVTVLAILLWRSTVAGSINEESLAAYSKAEMEAGGPLRMIGWAFVGTVVGATLFGYIALSSFLVDQGIWLAILYALLRLCLAFIDEFIGSKSGRKNNSSVFLQANTGLTRRSLEQIAVVTNGLLRVFIIFNAAMLALLPWGVESLDYTGLLKAAFFGFRVGDITISVSTVVFACAIFAVGVGVTRVIQRWLEGTYLPATNLDAGLRNSIKTGVGYIGIFIAATATFSYFGVSLDRITIVAGALSVGLGFGLQSIVNNFVSGLILLWERPIRVGDLVVVGDGEGHVRRINVRSTEIQTSDRTTIIVPNSNLISGVVRNRVRADRMGRVVISVPVTRGADPDKVVELMKACALDHRDVASAPAPSVLFKRIGETTLDFDLVCFVEEIEVASRVSSELHFAIFRILRDADIIPMPCPTTINLKGLEHIEQSILSLAKGRPVCPPSDGTVSAEIVTDDDIPSPPVAPSKKPSPVKRRTKNDA